MAPAYTKAILCIGIHVSSPDMDRSTSSGHFYISSLHKNRNHKFSSNGNDSHNTPDTSASVEVLLKCKVNPVNIDEDNTHIYTGITDDVDLHQPHGQTSG